MAQTAFAEWLDRKMRRAGYGENKSQLARDIGVGTSTVSAWFWRNTLPSTDTCGRLAHLFRVPVEDILRLAGHLPPLEPEPRALREAPSPYDGEIAEIVRDLDEESKRRVVVIARALLDDQRQQLN